MLPNSQLVTVQELRIDAPDEIAGTAHTGQHGQPFGFHPMIWCCDGKTFAKSCLELYGVDSKFVVWSGRAESLVLIRCDHIRANETRVV